jgi:hypothetical protein
VRASADEDEESHGARAAHGLSMHTMREGQIGSTRLSGPVRPPGP